MLKAIKIQLYPSKDQICYLANLLGSSRFVYNKLLEYKIHEYNENEYNVTFKDLGKKLTDLKSEHTFLKDVHSKVLQQSLINLEAAYKNFFKDGKGFPNFKSKNKNNESCRFPVDAIGKITGNRINIIRPLKFVHFKCSIKDEIYLNKHQGLIRSATLTKTKSNKYFLSILINRETTKVLPKTDNIVGIDVGVKTFIVDSDGNQYDNLKSIRSNEKKLIHLQREISRKELKSRNRDKARVKLARFNERIRNKKENYLHTIVNQLLNDNQVIVIEDLNVKGMMKNHNLAKSIQELSLYRFKEILRYKAEWYGRNIIEIDRYFPSSKLCNCCGFKNKDLKLSHRTWKCPSCLTILDRDLNAAKNIRDEGKRLLLI